MAETLKNLEGQPESAPLAHEELIGKLTLIDRIGGLGYEARAVIGEAIAVLSAAPSAQPHPETPQGDWAPKAGECVICDAPLRDGAVVLADRERLTRENAELREQRDTLDWNKTIGAMRIGMPDYKARAEALAAAIKELLDAGVPMDMGCCFYCASLQPERRHNNGCNWAKLRALVMEQD